jgi:TRAP-type C4-dicarboxylate transport system substrate-binding protein
MRKLNLLFAVVSILLSASFMLSACGPANSTSATAATSVPAAKENYELKFAYHTPPKASMVTAYFNPWTKSIEDASNGRIKITHYAGESLVRGRDQYDAVESGLCDIALVDPSETPGRFPQSEFDTLPFLFPDTYVGAKVYWDIVQKYLVNADFKNVVVLGVLLIPPCNYIGNKPVKDPSDFKGNRVRFSARTEAWTIEALGGAPVEVQTADLYTSMERGLIDSTFLAWSFIATVGLAEVSKYSTDCSLYCRAWPIMMNRNTWNSLGTDLQKMVMAQSGQEISAKYTAENEVISQGVKKGVANSFKIYGLDPIYELTPDQTAAWKAAVLPVWDKWANDLETTKKLPGKAIIADVKALVTKYSAK